MPPLTLGSDFMRLINFSYSGVSVDRKDLPDDMPLHPPDICESTAIALAIPSWKLYAVTNFPVAYLTR